MKTNESRRTTSPSRKKVHKNKPKNEEVPLRDYAALIALFNTVLASFLLSRKNSDLPERVGAGDLFLLGLATQKFSRVLTRDRVTQPLRAPFTEYEGSGGAGQLVTCPYCAGTWVASIFIYGFVLNARVTRLVASIFAVGSIADFVQHGYAKTKELTE